MAGNISCEKELKLKKAAIEMENTANEVTVSGISKVVKQ